MSHDTLSICAGGILPTHTWMSHDTHTWMSHSTHTYMTHVTHTNESWHTHEFVMIHIDMSHDTLRMHAVGTLTIYNIVMAHICIRHGHTYKWLLACTYMSRGCGWVVVSTWMAHTHMNTQMHLNKQKLGEPLVYFKPVEQTLYSATVPIKKNAWHTYEWTNPQFIDPQFIHCTHMTPSCACHYSLHLCALRFVRYIHYIYVYIYISIHKYVWKYINTYVLICLFTYKYISIYVYTYAYIWIHICICIYIYTKYVYICAYIYIYKYTYIHINIYIYIYIYICIYIYIYIHICVCVCAYVHTRILQKYVYIYITCKYVCVLKHKGLYIYMSYKCTCISTHISTNVKMYTQTPIHECTCTYM